MTRVLGAVLAALAASPFTAPFSACRLSSLLGGESHAAVVAPGFSAQLVTAPAAERSYPVQSLVEEHFNDAVPQQSWVVDDSAGVFRVIVALRVAPHAVHVAPPVLRI
jgi:hypothetical protein